MEMMNVIKNLLSMWSEFECRLIQIEINFYANYSEYSTIFKTMQNIIL
jgi:hypothetical protein